MTHAVQTVRHLDVHAAVLERLEQRHHLPRRQRTGHGDHAGHSL